MQKKNIAKSAALASGAIVLASAGVAPAAMADAKYPPNPETTSTPTTVTTTTSNSAEVQGSTPAYTGSSTTVFGLLAGLAAVGVGGGLLVASRRKNS